MVPFPKKLFTSCSIANEPLARIGLLVGRAISLFGHATDVIRGPLTIDVQGLRAGHFVPHDGDVVLNIGRQHRGRRPRYFP